MRYYTKTTRIGANMHNNHNPEIELEEEINRIYSSTDITVVNMTITPVIGTHEGLRVVDEYWIVFVYC